MILITGAAGFIGSHLVESLLSHREQIIGLDNLCDFYEISLKKYNLNLIKNHSNSKLFTFIKKDITDLESLENVFEEYSFDTVIHFAAMAGVRPSIERPLYYQKVNIQGTQNLLECCKKYSIKKFIFASSSSIYGNNKKLPFSEEDFVDNPISPYAATKKSCELICYTYHYLYEIDLICLRFFTVYGPRQRPDLAIHKFFRLIAKHKPIPFYGDGTAARDYTFIDDIIDGVIKSYKWLLKNKKVYEIFNLGNSHPVSLKTLVELISPFFDNNIEINKLPLPQGDVNITYADISKAQKYFDYQPKTDIKEGLDKFFKWFSSYYKNN